MLKIVDYKNFMGVIQMILTAKNNRYSGVLSAIFLCLGFSSTAEGMAKGGLVAGVVVAGVTGGAVAADVVAKIMPGKNEPAGEETKQFVRDTLEKAGYSDEQIARVKIRQGKEFLVRWRTLEVPFTDKKLQRARFLYESEDVPAQEERLEELMRENAWPIRLYYGDSIGDLSKEDVEAYFLSKNQIETKKSIPLWQGNIVHEMGHIVHSHWIKKAIISLLPRALFLLMVSAQVISDPVMPAICSVDSVKPAICSVAAVATFSLLYLRSVSLFERQADQELVDRGQDAEQFEVQQDFFERYSKFYDASFSKWVRFFDEHPHPQERARTFQEAHDRLLAQQKAAA